MQEIEWESCLLEWRSNLELERRFVRETGRPGMGIGYLVGVPWVEEAMLAFSLALETRVVLDGELADLAALVVAQDNSCRYCFASMRAFLRILGMPEGRIAGLESDLLAADFSPRVRGALRFARRLSRSDPLCTPDEVRALREAGFDALEAAELAAVAALNLFFNRVATLVALPPQRMEKLPDRWPVRLFRPLVALRVRGVRRRARPEPLRPQEKGRPYGYVVEGLDGLPVARALRAVVDGMWESKVLPLRAKLLVFAVVSRALDCACSEKETARLLAAEGLARPELEAILAHLASPVLDPLERRVVPFARETIRYEPARIQQRGRELLGALGREPFLELVGTAALANAVCRLGFLGEAAAG